MSGRQRLVDGNARQRILEVARHRFETPSNKALAAELGGRQP